MRDAKEIRYSGGVTIFRFHIARASVIPYPAIRLVENETIVLYIAFA